MPWEAVYGKFTTPKHYSSQDTPLLQNSPLVGLTQHSTAPSPACNTANSLQHYTQPATLYTACKTIHSLQDYTAPSPACNTVHSLQHYTQPARLYCSQPSLQHCTQPATLHREHCIRPRLKNKQYVKYTGVLLGKHQLQFSSQFLLDSAQCTL